MITLYLIVLAVSWVLMRILKQFEPEKLKKLTGLFAVLSIPGLLIPMYYLHLFDDRVWYYEFRSIRFIEVLAVLTVPFFYTIWSVLPKLKKWICLILFSLLTLPFLKHIVTPLDFRGLENRVVEGITLQSAASTCGPSSMATLLRARGIEMSEQEAARQCRTTLTGTEVWHIKRYLDRLGIGSKFIIDRESAPLYPAMAGVVTEKGFGHFISILDRTGEKYITGDPLVGREEIDASEIQKRFKFTGFYLKLWETEKGMAVNGFWEDVRTGKYPRIDLPDPYMEGACGQYFRHANPLVENFRDKVSIYLGDWEVDARVVPRKDFPNMDFREFTANTIRMRNACWDSRPNAPEFILEERFPFLSKPDEWDKTNFMADFSTPPATPVEYFWKVFNFNTLMWDWPAISEKILKKEVPESYIYGRSPHGTRFPARIFTEVWPGIKYYEVYGVLDTALAGLRKMPDLAQGISRGQFIKIITWDLNLLSDICQKYETFGRAVLPGAEDVVTRTEVEMNDGNFRSVFLETTAFYYAFYMSTS